MHELGHFSEEFLWDLIQSVSVVRQLVSGHGNVIFTVNVEDVDAETAAIYVRVKLFICAFVQHSRDKFSALLQAFDDVMNKIQWGLPDYVKPSPAAIDKKDGSKPIKIRIMFSGMDYILNDYEYLLLGDNAANDEVIFIDNDDLKNIIKELNLPWETPDSFTVIAPKLSNPEWNKFVEAAKRFNKKEEIDKTKQFIFEVKDVFKLNVFDVLVGKGNIPMYKGKIHCGNTELEVTPMQGNDYTHLESLSFFVKKGKADKKMIGKVFMEKIST